MTSGFHSHYCPRCREQKDCAQTTHCRKAATATCADCVYDVVHAAKHRSESVKQELSGKGEQEESSL